MYTEENEFDYNDYLDENLNSDPKKPFFNFRIILKVLFIILCIILIIFLVFKIKNHNSRNNKDNKTNVDNDSIALISNIDKIRDASYNYFFTNNNLPKEVGESVEINIKGLIDNNLITSVKDSNGYVCGYRTSNAILTKNTNDYELKIHLICPKENDTVTYYYSLDGNCLNCNGELYTPQKNDEVETKPETEIIPEQPETPVKEEVKVCKDYSEWTTVYNADNNLDRETRTLVKGYKTETTYGEWSDLSSVEIIPTNNLEVKTVEKEETKTTKTSWSKESTTKPKSKAGREISSRVKTITSTSTSCTGGKTYTRTLTKWDNSAYSCKLIKIGKVVCTYKTKKTCKTVTNTQNVTYYKYRDTVNKTETKTYYQSRTINQNISYTDYILESNMPEGYTKLPGSERVEYRYREKCDK